MTQNYAVFVQSKLWYEYLFCKIDLSKAATSAQTSTDSHVKFVSEPSFSTTGNQSYMVIDQTCFQTHDEKYKQTSLSNQSLFFLLQKNDYKHPPWNGL